MHKSNWLIFSSVLIGAGGFVSAAQAQDAVTGFVDLGAGSYRDVDYRYIIGSARLRTETPFSFQIDAMAGELDDEFAGGVATHAIWELDELWQLGGFASAMKVNAGGGIEAQQLGIEGSFTTDNYEISGYVGHQFNFLKGAFGGISVTAYPLDDLSLGIEHSFGTRTDGTTSLSLEKRFGAGRTSYSLYSNAGYVHDTESWSIEGGFRIYFGNSSRRDFVTRGFSGSRSMSRMMTSQFRTFMQAAAKQTQTYNETVVE